MRKPPQGEYSRGRGGTGWQSPRQRDVSAQTGDRGTHSRPPGQGAILRPQGRWEDDSAARGPASAVRGMRGSSRVLKSIVLAFATISGVGAVVCFVWCDCLFVCLFACLLICLSAVGWDIKNSDVSSYRKKRQRSTRRRATEGLIVQDLASIYGAEMARFGGGRGREARRARVQPSVRVHLPFQLVSVSSRRDVGPVPGIRVSRGAEITRESTRQQASRYHRPLRPFPRER